MALNVLMHPRNPYRDKRPDFKTLAEKFAEFREHTTTDAKGKVHIDFKNAACLRALTWALLKNDFDLDVKMPLDRLIPTIPLRLNYILWLEDIFSSGSKLHGIDIGAGAACIYPLLGAKTNGWQFLATEVDPTNAEYARENVARNDLADVIKVVSVGEDSCLLDILRDSDSSFDFCLCNPPFYGSNIEAWGWLTTKPNRERPRPEPSSVNTASPVEGISPGGEVQFVQQRIIESSLELKSRIRVYSTMLGKKTSVPTLKEVLRMNGITNIGTTEFCQGKTMRWGLAWSFDPTVKFPKPMSKVLKAQKPKPPLTYSLPQKLDNLVTVAARMEAIFNDLQVSYSRLESDEDEMSTGWKVLCRSNTWSHQRRKRRQMKREERQSDTSFSSPTQTDVPETAQNRSTNASDEPCQSLDDGTGSALTKQPKLDCQTENCSVSDESASHQRIPVAGSHSTSSGGFAEETLPEDAKSSVESLPVSSDSIWTDGRQSSPTLHSRDEGESSQSAEFVLPCDIVVRKLDEGGMVLELNDIGGQNRELLHQLLQYFKNRLV